MKRLACLALLAATCALASDFPQPSDTEPDTTTPLMPAAEAAAKMRVPPGFKVSVFAAEPDVQNPIAMAWDARGRMWVAENYTYAEKAKRFDLGLRDRVIIFEDADNDGRAESRKVFTDEVQMLTSVETGHGGVWLMCPPQLLFIPDANGDDVPDGAPQVVLDGFTVAKDNYHNFANGLRWGPDGWLYGRCGHTCPGRLGLPGTPDELRVPMKGGIWRYHPARKIVEVLTHGTTNPWGHDWDANGEMFFINTVTGHLWHLMPGAHLHDSRPSPNPGVFERLDTIADHYHFDTKGTWANSRDGKANDFGGGHAHIGMMIYQGNTWPENYRGKLFTLNMHGRRANMDRLERLGSGYVGRHEPDFMLSADPWFRGLEISTGPDGNAFVLDWSDIGECHEHTGVHRTSGRIYKVSYGDPKPPVAMLTPACMNGPGKLPALWKQYQEGRTTPEMLRGLLQDTDEHVRVWAIRLLTDFWPLDTIVGPRKDAVYPSDDESLALFVKLAKEDTSGLVRLSLASTLQRLPVAERTELATALVSHSENADDAQLPAMVWFGLIPVADADPTALLSVTKVCTWPKTLRWAARCLAMKLERQPEPLNELLISTVDSDSRWRQLAVLEGMTDAFKGWQKAPMPASWETVAAKSPHKDLVRDLSILFGDGRALDDVKKTALDPEAEFAQRQAALETLIANRPPDLQAICTQLLDTKRLCSIAVRGLALVNDPALSQRLAADYRKFDPDDRPAVMNFLLSRAASAKAMLANVGDAKTQIPRADITAFHARQMRAFGDEVLTKKLTEVWGELRESTEDKRQLIQRLKTKLTPGVLAKADLSQGRVLFQNVCGACHTMYGSGGRIGPDLTGSGRANLDYLLENIVDPSAVVPADYRMSTLTLKDGRVLGGLVAETNERTLTLRTPTEPLTIERSEIVKQEVSPLSMMPEGLLQVFQPDQVRDLIAYLMHPAQVPLPRN